MEESMIHPENCTKEELVYFITHSMFYDKLKFDSSIKDYRDSKNTKLAHNAFEIADKCMKECAELEKKYSGCNISDIPVHELKKLKTLEEKARKYYARSDELWKKILGN